MVSSEYGNYFLFNFLRFELNTAVLLVDRQKHIISTIVAQKIPLNSRSDHHALCFLLHTYIWSFPNLSTISYVCTLPLMCILNWLLVFKIYQQLLVFTLLSIF